MTDTPQVRQLFADKQPGPAVEDISATYVETARAIAQICSTRMLLMIAVLTGAGIWGFTIWDPQQSRLYAAIAFSLVFVLPQVALFWKRG
jgi:hypothetical protein